MAPQQSDWFAANSPSAVTPPDDWFGANAPKPIPAHAAPPPPMPLARSTAAGPPPPPPSLGRQLLGDVGEGIYRGTVGPLVDITKGTYDVIRHPIENLPTIAATGATLALGPEAGAGVRLLTAGGTGAVTAPIRSWLKGESPTVSGSLTEAGKQMLLSVPGEVLGATSSGIMRPPPGSPDARVALANQELGLRLTPGEIRSTVPGRTLGGAQWVSGRSLTGHAIAASAQEQGTQAGLDAVVHALDAIGPLQPKTTVGTRVAAGVRQGSQFWKGRIGPQLDQVIASAPDVDFTGVKAEAQRILDEEFQPFAETFLKPAAEAGQAVVQSRNLGPISASQYPGLASNPFYQKVAAETAQQAHDAALARMTSPALTQIRRILNAPDQVPFAQAAQLRTALREAGKAPDELIGARARGTVTHLHDLLSDSMRETSPDWAVLSGEYGAGARRFTSTFIRQTLRDTPEKIIAAVGRNNPSRAASLKQALLEDAGTAETRSTWNSFRVRWAQDALLKDGTGKVNLNTIGTRLAQTDPTTLQILFDDKAGQAFLGRLRQVSEAFSRRQALGTHSLKTILEASGIIGGITGVASGRPALGVETALASAAGYEGVTAFVTWALHSPRLTKMLVEGVTSKDVGSAMANLSRLLLVYKTTGGQPEPEMIPAHGGPPAAPTRSTSPARSAPPPPPPRPGSSPPPAPPR